MITIKVFRNGNGLILLIKPFPSVDYSNVIDILDEGIINKIKKYAIIEPGTDETNFMKETMALVPGNKNWNKKPGEFS